MNELIPQINEIVTDFFNQGYYPEDLQLPLYNRYLWDQMIPYADVKLNFNYAEMKLTGWINAAECITGSDDSFNLRLMEIFKTAITEQWELRMPVEDGFKQLEFNHEHQVKLGAAS